MESEAYVTSNGSQASLKVEGVNVTPEEVLGELDDNDTVARSLLEPERALVMEFQFWTFGVLGTAVVFLGFVANVLAIVVLCQRRMRSSTSYYLVVLAVYDNIILISMQIFFNLPSLEPKVGSMTGYKNWMNLAIPAGYPISLTAQMAAIYTCVGFTVERYFAVCRPLHAANTCTKSRTKAAILVIFLWSVLYNVPRYLHYKVTAQWDNVTNTTVWKREETEFAKSQLFQHAYHIYLQLIFMFIVPFAILVVLNTALIRVVNRSYSRRQQMSASAVREHNLTIMLIAVVICFLICQSPSVVDNIFMAIKYRFPKYSIFFTVCTFMVELNSSTNFFLYCVFGRKFRMVCVHLLGFRSKQRCQYRSSVHHSRTTNGTTHIMEVSLV